MPDAEMLSCFLLIFRLEEGARVTTSDVYKVMDVAVDLDVFFDRRVGCFSDNIGCG